MNTANTVSTILLLVALVVLWLRVGILIHDWLSEKPEVLPVDVADSLIVLLGPLSILPILSLLARIIMAKKLEPTLERRRIRREAEAARAIDEAQPEFDPRKYKPEQWKG